MRGHHDASPPALGCGPGCKVAVVGVGGPGHMAVAFAHAVGAEVTTLSRPWTGR